MDNIKAIEEILDKCCPEKEADMCMLKGCNHCEAVYLHEHGVTAKVQGHIIKKKRHRHCLSGKAFIDEAGRPVCETVSYEDVSFYCSVCGKVQNGEWLNYCDNCGAKMRGETDE